MSVHAGHLSSAYIEYECLGGGQYEVTLNIIQDCSDPLVEDDFNIRVIPDCNFMFFSVNIPFLDQTDISQVCPNEEPFTYCQGGTQRGFRLVRYRGVVDIPADCPSVKVLWKQNYRTAADNIQEDFYSIYTESIVFPQDYCVSTPSIDLPSILQVCSGYEASLNLGISTIDGDSTALTLTDPLYSPAGNSTAPLPFIGGASADSPVPGFTFDEETGQIGFPAGNQGSYSFAIAVEDFDEGGNLQSHMHLDLRFMVINCGVSGITAGDDVLLNPSPGTDLLGPRRIELCRSERFCADFVLAKNWNNVDFQVDHNMEEHLDGVQTEFQVEGDSVRFTFCGTSRDVPEEFQLFFTLEDEQCVYNGRVQASCIIEVTDESSASVFIEDFGDALAFNTPQTGETYQWYANGNAMDGQTSSELSSEQLSSGTSYQLLVVSENGCSSISNTISLPVGLNEHSWGAAWTVYPNPSSGILYVDGPLTRAGIRWEVLDQLGRIIHTDADLMDGIDLEVLPSGHYLLRGVDSKGARSLPLRFAKY